MINLTLVPVVFLRTERERLEINGIFQEASWVRARVSYRLSRHSTTCTIFFGRPSDARCKN
jgi:hypothetical protein